MAVLSKWVLIKTDVESNFVYKIAHRSKLYIKTQHGPLKITSEDDLNRAIYITTVNDDEVKIKIFDHHDDPDVLRERNKHVTDKRIPIIKRTSIGTPTAGLKKNPKLPAKKKKNIPSGKSKDDDESDHFYALLDDNDNDVSVPGNRHQTISPDLPHDDVHDDNSGSTSPLRETHEPFAPSSPRNESNINLMETVNHIQTVTTTNSRQINQLRRVCITKKSLDESLENFARRMTTANKENCCQSEEPQFNADNKVQILNDFAMDYNLYYSAITASTNSYRAKKVMAQFWSEGERLQLLTTYDPKRPEMRIVSDTEYKKLIEIMNKLQEIQAIPVHTPKDRVLSNMKKWVSAWLKSKKSTIKNRETLRGEGEENEEEEKDD
ncbi:uncharacterized protein LOC130674325 [Microplitis mediator]|uniref:uncharacterized protein LOC130668444 n=1 Tax=Microplitis mediator TaxID=375433 RepID=UPI002552575C|nr:uncharacterized protein LOC130668444 [Microplitis mediator]XP_057335606.1 uncharacterized protein LOC130674325 [Microplitis mediator]